MSNGFAVNWESREKQQPSLGNWLLRSALPRQLHHLFVFAPLLICTTHKSQRISLSLFSFLHLFFPSFPTFTCSVHVRLQIAFKPILPRRVSSVMNKLVNLVFFFFWRIARILQGIFRRHGTLAGIPTKSCLSPILRIILHVSGENSSIGFSFTKGANVVYVFSC